MTLIAKLDQHLLATVQRSIYTIHVGNKTITVTDVPVIIKKDTQTQTNGDQNGDNDGDTPNGLTHINHLDISEANRLVAVTTIDKFLFLYQFTDDGQLTLLRHVPLVRCTSKIRFTPDGKHILVADKTGDCYIVSCDDENPEVKWILGHLSLVLDIMMSKDSRFVITSDRDEKVRITNYPQTENIQSYCLGHLEYVSAIEQLPADNLLVSVSGDKTLRVWNYLTGSQLFQLDLDVPALHLASFGNRFAVTLLGEQQTLAIFEATTNDDSPHLQKVAEFTFSPDVKHITKIVYESNDQLYVAYDNKTDQSTVKSFQVDGNTLKCNENESTVIEELLDSKLNDRITPLSIDLAMLFKKKHDESQVLEYYERKKRRIEEKKN